VAGSRHVLGDGQRLEPLAPVLFEQARALHGVGGAFAGEREIVVVADELAGRGDQADDLERHPHRARRPAPEQLQAFPRRDAERPADDPAELALPLRARAVLQRPVRAEAVRRVELLRDDEDPGLANLEANWTLVVLEFAERLARADADPMIAGLRRREQLRHRRGEALEARHVLRLARTSRSNSSSHDRISRVTACPCFNRWRMPAALEHVLQIRSLPERIVLSSSYGCPFRQCVFSR